MITFIDFISYALDYSSPWIETKLHELNSIFSSQKNKCSLYPWKWATQTYRRARSGLYQEVIDYCAYKLDHNCNVNRQIHLIRCMAQIKAEIEKFNPSARVSYVDMQSMIGVWWQRHCQVFISDNWDLWPPTQYYTDIFSKLGWRIFRTQHIGPKNSFKITDAYGSISFEVILVQSDKERYYYVEQSKLIWYYSQVYPQLINLYAIISTPLLIDQNQSNVQAAIDGYSLVLLITAYLKQLAPRELKANDYGTLLLGFLRFYASKFDYSSQCLRIPSTKYNKDVIIEVTPINDYSNNERDSLIIYDPIANASGDNAAKLEPSWSVSKIKSLFDDWAFKLNQSLQPSKLGSTIVDSHLSTFLPSTDEIKKMNSVFNKWEYLELRDESKLTQHESWTKRIKVKNIASTLIYLSIFFVIRNTLLYYLTNLERNATENLQREFVRYHTEMKNELEYGYDNELIDYDYYDYEDYDYEDDDGEVENIDLSEIFSMFL